MADSCNLVDLGWQDSPFRLENEVAYRGWRRSKLKAMDNRAASAPVVIRDPRHLRASELGALLGQISLRNWGIYELVEPRHTDKQDIGQLGTQLGLRRLDENPCADHDGITSLEVSDEVQKRDYIPYSNRPMCWHTDGYYNLADAPVRAFILHCQHDAARGGENAFLDPEYVYLRLRDENPRLLSALMTDDVMTIPENQTSPLARRPAQTGPVFSVNPVSGHLHMRYTARLRSIVWKAGDDVQRAREFVTNLLSDSRQSRVCRLRPGQGIIANNVLHKRFGFEDPMPGQPGRLVYRARYHDRVSAESNPAPAYAVSA